MRFQDQNGNLYGTDAVVEIDGIRYKLRKQSPEKLFSLGFSIVQDPPPAYTPPEPTLADYQRAIEAHVDAVAQERQYSSGVSCASYVSSTNPLWAAEAAAFVAWRDAMWVYAFTELAKVEQGLRSVPTVQEFLDELPVIEWPEPENES